MNIYYDITKDYLKKQCEIIKNSGFKIINKSTNKNTAVIIEPRKHELLESIIFNVMFHLKEDWNLHVFCSFNNIEFIKEIFINNHFYISEFTLKDLNPNNYNRLLQNIEFWESFITNNVLIFQTDSYICNQNICIKDFMNYPFIGGIYKNGFFNDDYNKLKKKNLPEDATISNVTYNYYREYDINLHDLPKLDFSINGGFSFRKKNVMIECIKKVNLDDIIEYRKQNNMNIEYFKPVINIKKINTNLELLIGEDVFFQHACEILGYRMPCKEECIKFCTNTLMDNPEESFAIHNINKYNSNKQLFYLNPSLFDILKNDNKSFNLKKEFNNILNNIDINITEKLKIYHNLVKIDYGNKFSEDVEQYLCMKHIEEKDIILEIGGNIGRVSILLSTLINDDKNLVVLESNNKHYNELLINKNQNGCNFTVLNNALSKYPLYQYQWLTFTLKEYNNIREDERHLLKQINIISYEEIIENYNLNFNTLILDCEGAFYYIVRDYPEILKNIKKIIIENDFRYIEQYYYITELFLKNNFIIKETVKLDEKYWDWHTNPIIRDNFNQVWVKNSE